MKNKFWCVLKVFLNKLLVHISKIVLMFIISSFAILALMFFISLIPDYIWNIMYIIFVLLFLLTGIYVGISNLWQKSKEECWDILGDNK